MGCSALTGNTNGGIGEWSGLLPPRTENHNVAGALAAALQTKRLGVGFGIKPLTQDETHLIDPDW